MTFLKPGLAKAIHSEKRGLSFCHAFLVFILKIILETCLGVTLHFLCGCYFKTKREPSFVYLSNLQEIIFWHHCICIEEGLQLIKSTFCRFLFLHSKDKIMLYFDKGLHNGAKFGLWFSYVVNQQAKKP